MFPSIVPPNVHPAIIAQLHICPVQAKADLIQEREKLQRCNFAIAGKLRHISRLDHSSQIPYQVVGFVKIDACCSQGMITKAGTIGTQLGNTFQRQKEWCITKVWPVHSIFAGAYNSCVQLLAKLIPLGCMQFAPEENNKIRLFL